MKIFVIPEDLKGMYIDLLPDEIRDRDLILIGAAAESRGNRMELCGIRAYEYYGEGIWELSYIHVIEAMRHQGVGTKMIEYATTVIRGLGGDEIMAAYIRDDESKDLFSCLLRSHFEIESESAVKSASIGEFNAAIDNFLPSKKPFSVYPLNGTDDLLWEDLSDLVLDMSRNDRGDEVYPVLADMGSYEQDASVIVTDEETDNIKGTLLFEEAGELLSVSYIWARHKTGPVTGKMIKSSFETIEKKYGPQKTLCFHTLNPAADRLAEKLLTHSAPKIGDAVVLKRTL